MHEERGAHVAYRAVLLAAGLLLVGLLFRQLVTLLLAILITIIVSIPLAAAATRLQRHGVPRPIGALAALLGGVLAVSLLIYLLIPPFVDQSDEFVEDVPRIVDDLETVYADVTGEDPGQVGDRVQEFVENWTDDPERLIGPITSIGLNLAGVLGALVLILITAYYMAVRPDPLTDGLVSLFPPRRRAHVRHVMDRLRISWIGWMEGVAIDMLVTFVLLWLGLELVGLDFAIFFAVLSALLVVVPYFGAIAGAIPPVLFALTDSPGKALRGARRLHPRAAAREQRDDPADHVAAHPDAPGDDRHRRGGGGSAVRLRRPVRGRADPVAARDRSGGVLGQARGGVRRPPPQRRAGPAVGHRRLRRAW